MLDQNTDRMWYVIGALVVGAGIILLANKMLPEVFANTGKSFENIVGNTSAAIDEGLKSNKVGVNLISYQDQHKIWQHPTGKEYTRTVDLAPILEEQGLDNTYTLSFDAKSADTSKKNTLQIYMQSGYGSQYGLIYKTVTYTEEYQHFEFTGLKPYVYTNYYAYHNGELDKPMTTAHLAFYGVYETGNSPIVTNLSLVKE